MRSQMNRTPLGLLLTAVLAVSCGDGSAPTSPSTERVSGVWMGHITLRSAGGGGCVGPTLQSSVGTSRDIFAAHIQQNAESLTATVGYQGNQTSCADRKSTRLNSSH